jgi:hypothetical protein
MLIGLWGVGLATRNTDLNQSPGGRDAESWVVCWDGVFRHNNTELHKIQDSAQEGDILVRILQLVFGIWVGICLFTTSTCPNIMRHCCFVNL